MDFIGQMVEKNLGDYGLRCERAVSLLAGACGQSPDLEVERFKRVMDTMGQVPKARGPGAPDNPFAALQAKVIEAMPPVVEFVTTHTSSKLQGFGYLTEGRPGSDLPSTLMAKLENTFRICLTEGGIVEDGEVLADVFRLVFPDVGHLADHSPLAQAVLMGFVPSGDKLLIKAYFNTRLGSGNHETLVRELLTRLDLDGAGFYQRLYSSQVRARFVGVGVDLHGDAANRAKLYVKVSTTDLDEALSLLLQGQAYLNPNAARSEATALLVALESDALAGEVEIAIGLRSDASPTLKLTAFFSSDETSTIAEESVLKYIESKGYASTQLQDAFELMRAGVSDPGVKKQPVHGLGIEFPMGEQVKINTYFNPLV